MKSPEVITQALFFPIFLARRLLGVAVGSDMDFSSEAAMVLGSRVMIDRGSGLLLEEARGGVGNRLNNVSFVSRDTTVSST